MAGVRGPADWIVDGMMHQTASNHDPSTITRALVEVVETVFTFLGQHTMDVTPWQLVKHSPPPLLRQLNDWSCGFFVIDAMQVAGRGEDISTVTNQKTAINLAQSALRRAATPGAPFPRAGYDSDAHLKRQSDFDQPDSERPKKKAKTSADRIEKKKTERQVAPKKKMSSAEDRKKMLTNNPNITWVQPHKVKCAKCLQEVKLHSDRNYKLENWTQHEQTCLQITGVLKTRIVTKKSAGVPPRPKGVSSIASFMTLKNNGSTKAVDSALPVDSPTDGESSNDESEAAPWVNYTTIKTAAVPSVLQYFRPGPMCVHWSPTPIKTPIETPEERPCAGLVGEQYAEYIDRTETRSLGGVGAALRAGTTRKLFPYKDFPALKNAEPVSDAEAPPLKRKIPKNAVSSSSSSDWTAAEQEKADTSFAALARWRVDYGRKIVRATRCSGMTMNTNGVCDACQDVAKDPSFKTIVRRKQRESEKPLEEQHQILLDRAKFSNKRGHDFEARNLDLTLKDPVAFKALKLLEKGQPTEAFLQLYDATRTGKLDRFNTFKELCAVVTEVIHRKENNSMNGMRYSPHILILFLHSAFVDHTGQRGAESPRADSYIKLAGEEVGVNTRTTAPGCRPVEQGCPRKKAAQPKRRRLTQETGSPVWTISE
ncbi:hypothetical protein C8F01DRAFT_1224581 [Mycena amicta]|nr:hypothetical protein C8F01DRAFT_1224581 [Mycena amicta]